jgi:hypothetical protein
MASDVDRQVSEISASWNVVHTQYMYLTIYYELSLLINPLCLRTRILAEMGRVCPRISNGTTIKKCPLELFKGLLCHALALPNFETFGPTILFQYSTFGDKGT